MSYSHGPTGVASLPADGTKQDTGLSYLLWVGCFFGLSGLHRLYNRKFGTGILWLLTWGLFGVGQFVDLFLIPDMVEDRAYRRWRRGVGSGAATDAAQVTADRQLSDDALMKRLLEAAQVMGGKLSVTQGVMATGADFSRVEACLKRMMRSGYVSTGNDPKTGTVTYHFDELAG